MPMQAEIIEKINELNDGDNFGVEQSHDDGYLDHFYSYERTERTLLCFAEWLLGRRKQSEPSTPLTKPYLESTGFYDKQFGGGMSIKELSDPDRDVFVLSFDNGIDVGYIDTVEKCERFIAQYSKSL